MSGGVSLRRTSLVDYPGKVSAVIFFPGCNLRCPWCHNAALVDPAESDEAEALIDIDEALAFLRKRRSVLGGVVLSGGEPLLRADLGGMVERVRELGLHVKIDTNGTLPDRLEALLSRPETTPDYVAVDLKLAPERYPELGGIDAGAALKRCAEALRSSDVDLEFRSVALPGGAFTEADLRELAPLAQNDPWFFAPFAPGSCLDRRWDSYPPTGRTDAEALAAAARNQGASGAAVRGA